MDPMQRLSAADPVPDAERLSDSERREADALLARILAEQPERTRRPLRRFAVAIAVAGCAVAIAIALTDVLDEEASGPGVVERAVAAVSEPDSIYHTVELLRIRGPAGHEALRAYVEAWHGPNHTTHRKDYDFQNGRKGRLRSEQVHRLWPKGKGRFGGRGAMYDPRRNTITRVRVGRVPMGAIPFLDPDGDPAAGMRELQRDGRLRLVGSERLDGKRVYRLTSGPIRWARARHRIDYLVDARTYYPAFVRWTAQAKLGRVASETRYLTYERLPYDAKHRGLLKMDPHPGAKVTGLPRR